MADLDPVLTDPDKYKVIFENDRVRVLDFHDTPGAKTKPHHHPDSVLLTLSDFQRRHAWRLRRAEVATAFARGAVSSCRSRRLEVGHLVLIHP
jgi:hypothetical protein